MEDTCENLQENSIKTSFKIKKKKKPGIIYISTLPPFMNVTKTKDIFSNYGEIGRIFLQPSESEEKGKKKKPAVHFSEGWIEFKSKRIAKEVAERLNNTLIGGKKRSKFYDYMWSLKYLPRFKWAHLGERLAYERAVRKQKLRAEISKAKREVNFFSSAVDKRKRDKNNPTIKNDSKFVITEIPTESEVIQDRTDFLKTLFN